MSNKLLWGIIVVLLVTNIATLLYFSGGEDVYLDEETKISSTDPVATIEGKDISYEEWMRQVRHHHGQAQLKTLVDQEVVGRLAAEKGIEIDERVIERELAYLTSMHGPLTEEAYEKIAGSWRDEVLFRYQLKLLLTEGASISEERLVEYYKEYENQYNFNSAMHLSHILVSDIVTAEKVYEELKAGAVFELLAMEYSLDEETRSDGGYLGFMEVDSKFFPNGYEEIAMDIGEHTYSEPFIVDNGFAILYVHQILPEITFTYEEIKEYLKSELVLHEEGIDAKADILWNELEVDWIYGD